MTSAIHHYAFGLLSDGPPARGVESARSTAITPNGEQLILRLPANLPIATLRERFYGRMLVLSPRHPDGSPVAHGLVAVWEGEAPNPTAHSLIARINGGLPDGISGTVAIVRHRDGRVIDPDDGDLLLLRALIDGYQPERAR